MVKEEENKQYEDIRAYNEAYEKARKLFNGQIGILKLVEYKHRYHAIGYVYNQIKQFAIHKTGEIREEEIFRYTVEECSSAMDVQYELQRLSKIKGIKTIDTYWDGVPFGEAYVEFKITDKANAESILKNLEMI